MATHALCFEPRLVSRGVVRGGQPPVVGEEDHERLLFEIQPAECLQDAPDAVVDTFDHRRVVCVAQFVRTRRIGREPLLVLGDLVGPGEDRNMNGEM